MNLADEPQNLWPDRHVVERIDALLREHWLLDLTPDKARIELKYPDLERRMTVYDEASERAVAKAGPNDETDEREVFRLLAHPGVFAVVGSNRRHYILDGIALAVGMLRRFGLKGPVLDVGCHAGTTVDILARLTPNHIVGLDPIGVAIDTARRQSAGLPNAEFHRGMLPWKATTPFDLTLCYDVFQHIPTARHMQAVASLGSSAREGAFVVITATDITARDWLRNLRPMLANAGLGYVTTDVLGGHGGYPDPSFLAAAVLVLRKGCTTPVPIDIDDLAARQWDRFFKDYANATTTPAREKTQAFERARRTSMGGTECLAGPH
jgi:SAM-dependent methyltransferase